MRSLSLLALASLLAAPVAAAQEPTSTTTRWAAEFARFDAADRENPPAPNGFVFVGSSSIRFWNTLQQDFPNLNVLNRGFGGSRISDVREHIDRVVIRYRPQMALVYAGDNDMAAGRTAADVVADYKAIVARIHEALPETRIAWISIKPSPSRWQHAGTMREANAEIERFTHTDPRLLYIDVFNPMIGPNGRPIPELFVSDSLHMTPAGYVLWRQIVAPFVTPQARPRPPDPTVEEVAAMMRQIRNWGRWGENDERGTINLITQEKRKQALALAREGITVSLAHTLDKEQAPDNPTPFRQEFQMRGEQMSPYAMDIIASTYHGTTTTHLDALCHYQFQGQMYNGYSYEEFYKATATRQGYGEGPGCIRNGVLNFKDGILTRGILIDLPLLRGVKWLEPGTAVTAQDLEDWEKFTGLRIGPGDALFLRTGRFRRRAEEGPYNANAQAPGFHVSIMPWMKERDVAILSSDIIQDLQPSNIQGLPRPIHMVSINALGMPLIDVTDLEAVAKVAARLNRWEFMLQVAPLPAPGGSGSPVNPIATF